MDVQWNVWSQNHSYLNTWNESNCFFQIRSNGSRLSDLENTKTNTIDLVSCNFHDIPRKFRITTNNGIYSFNTDLLNRISPIIRANLSNDPTQLEFHINIDDPMNIMKKVEDLFRMMTVEISKHDLPSLKQIFHNLGLQFPQLDETNSTIFQIEFNKSEATRIFRMLPQSIFIISNGTTYPCNPIGVSSSNILKEIRENYPTQDHLKFDLDDNESFLIIQRLFNFETIRIDYFNAEFLQTMCDVLQIDCIREKVEQYIQSLANIEEHITQPITKLFEVLYNIELKDPQNVCQYLLDTEWVHGKSNISEMTSCILQVIRTNLRLHPYILDLILLLDKQSNDINELSQFLPFFIQRLLQESNESAFVCAFLYKLNERKIVSFEQISKQHSIIQSKQAKNQHDSSKLSEPFQSFDQQLDHNNQNLEQIFWPEFEEHGISIACQNEKTRSMTFDLNQYKQMRQNFEPLNEILRLIIHDDAIAFQLKIAQDNININENVKLISLTSNSFAENIFPEVNLLNYAAENGSINCFKYLLLNNAEPLSDLLISAIRGGHTEIIRISHSKMTKSIPLFQTQEIILQQTIWNRIQKTEQTKKEYTNQLDIYIECLVVAITMHRYQIFEWIFEQIKNLKFVTKHIHRLFVACAQNGNLQAIIIMINHGIDIAHFFNDFEQNNSEKFHTQTSTSNPKRSPLALFYRFLIENGFYHFIQYFFKLTAESHIDYSLINDHSLILKSQNPSILKVLNKLPTDKIVYSAIKSNCSAILDDIWSNLPYFNQSIDYYNIYLCLATNNSSDMFSLITAKYPLDKSKQYLDSSQYLEIICIACSNCNSKVVEVFTDFLLRIDPHIDFTTPFIKSLSDKHANICKFFIDKNVKLDLLYISTKNDIIQIWNGQFVPLLFAKEDKSIQRQLFYSFLFAFISSSLNEHHKSNLLKFLSLYQSDELTSLLREISSNSPIVYAVYQGNAIAFNTLIEYLGDDLSNHIEQITFALKLIVEECSQTKNGNPIDIKQQAIFSRVNYIRILLSQISPSNLFLPNEIFFILSIQQSDIDLLKLCLDNIKTQTIFEEVSLNNPFILAIENLNLEAVNLFIRYFGNNISKKTKQIHFGIKSLLEKNERDSVVSFICNLSRDLPLSFKEYIDNDILFALYTKKISSANISLLLQHFPSGANVCESKTGNTPLMLAIIHDKPGIAELLVKCHEVDVTIKNRSNKTALSITLDKMQQCNESMYYRLLTLLSAQIDDVELDRAFYFCNDELALQLINTENLNVNYFHIEPKEPQFLQIKQPYWGCRTTDWHYSTSNSPNESHTDSVGPMCSTSLIHSIKMCQFKKAELIINHPHFDPQLSNINEAIFLSISKKRYEVFNQLLNFVDINSFNYKGRSLLSFCCDHQFEEGVIRIITDDKFDFVKIDFYGLLLSAFEGRTKFAIIQALADYDSNHSHYLNFNQLLPNGKSFFTHINYRKFKNTCEDNHNIQIPLILFLINKGVDVNKSDLFGVYPLQYAIQSHSLPYVETLLNSGKLDFSVRINTKHFTNGTYLHLAVDSTEEIIRKLISQNIFDLNSKDDLGRTPYMMMSQVHSKSWGNGSLLKLLKPDIKLDLLSSHWKASSSSKW